MQKHHFLGAGKSITVKFSVVTLNDF